MITAAEWDTHWWRIYNDGLTGGDDIDTACEVADDETAEQFGERPAEEQG